jgi:hypothetical protein
MINILQYLYYHIYIWLKKKWGEADDPKHTALFGITGTLFINLISIIIFAQKLSIIDLLIYFPKIPKIIIVVFATIFLLVLYLLLIYKGKFKKIIEKYKKESEAARKRGILITWIYIIGSYLIFFESVRMFF